MINSALNGPYNKELTTPIKNQQNNLHQSEEELPGISKAIPKLESDQSKKIPNPKILNTRENNLSKHELIVTRERVNSSHDIYEIRPKHQSMIGLTSVDSNKLIVDPSPSLSSTIQKEQASNFIDELSDINQPPREFFSQLITPQLEKLLKTKSADSQEIDLQKFYQTIESSFQASLCVTNGHFLEKIVEFISKVDDVKCAKEIIHKLFEKIQDNYGKSDPQCAQKFGNALAAALMNIAAEKERDEQFDMVRIGDRDAVEAALKNIYVKILLSDDSAKEVYKPVLYPHFSETLAIVLADYLWRLLKKEIPEDPNTIRPEKRITAKAFEKIKNLSGKYHQKGIAKDPEIYRKIWPSGIKAPFNGFYEALERLTPPNAHFNNTQNITIKLIGGKEVDVRAWKIGQLALFGSMSIFRTVFSVWKEEIRSKISDEKYIFEDQELLRASLKRMLFNPNFYFSSLPSAWKSLPPLIGKTLEEKYKIIDEENGEYQKLLQACSQKWSEKLKSKLEDLSHRSQLSDELELFAQVALKSQGKNLLSPEFEEEFNSCIHQFKMKRIAKRLRLLLNSPSFINLIKALPEFKFSEDKKSDEITALFASFMDNNSNIISKLSDQEFAGKIREFLKEWGERLQSVMQKKAATGLLTAIIERGWLNDRISNKLEDKFKLPISLEELPKMLEGMRELPDETLVEFIRGFASDPKLNEVFKENLIQGLLNDAGSPLVYELETFMLDQDLLSAHFDVLSSQSKELKKNLEPAKDAWNKFIKKILHLIQNKNFLQNFKSLWKDKGKMGCREQLQMIVFNPEIFSQYELFIIYAFFKEGKKKINETHGKSIVEITDHCVSMFYDLPNQTAAKKIREGEALSKPEPSIYDSELKKLQQPLVDFGFEGTITDCFGNKQLYPDALAQTEASFVDDDILLGCKKKEGRSRILSTLSEKDQKLAQDSLEKELADLCKHMLQFAKGKDKNEQRDLWHYVLRLAIESGTDKYINYCLDRINDLDTLNSKDVGKHFKFIVENKKAVDRSCTIMLNYFSKKPGFQECSVLIKKALEISETDLTEMLLKKK